MTRRSIVATLGLLFLVGLPSSLKGDERRVECDPTYRRLGEETAEVGELTISTSWVLIGCRNEIDAIGPEELNRVRRELALVSREHVWGLLALEEDRELRGSVAKRLERVTGRVVSDVLLTGYRIEE
jgi:hypothetical protein